MAGQKFTFLCPNCQGRNLKAYSSGPYITPVLSIDEDGEVEFGPIELGDNGVDSFQCSECQYEVVNVPWPVGQQEEITKYDELGKWIIENCPQ